MNMECVLGAGITEEQIAAWQVRYGALEQAA
jgi:hypothetical protein